MLRLHAQDGGHPDILRRFFLLPDPDPFFAAPVLSALHGEHWTSIVIEDGTFALRHAFAASAIADTGLYDIEPRFVYAGPAVTDGADRRFVSDALSEYSAYCRSRQIVAELIRFNPVLTNHAPMAGACAHLHVREAKPVAYLRVEPTAEGQLTKYPAKCRNMVRVGGRHLEIRTAQGSTVLWQMFAALHASTLRHAGAASDWDVSTDLFDRLRAGSRFELIAALQRDRMVAAAVILLGSPQSYYFLAASDRSSADRRGASNAVVHEATRLAAAAGAVWLGLGGGKGDSPADPLFRFKESFGSSVLPFAFGALVHDADTLRRLDALAVQSSSRVADSALFLRYRLAPDLESGRMQPAINRPMMPSHG